MIIIKTTSDSNGAYSNYIWQGEVMPEGFIAIPDEFLSVWEAYKPFVTIGFTDGAITSMVDNPTARTAQEEADASVTPEPTIEERTTALEATQLDVIEVLASALGVTI